MSRPKSGPPASHGKTKPERGRRHVLVVVVLVVLIAAVGVWAAFSFGVNHGDSSTTSSATITDFCGGDSVINCVHILSDMVYRDTSGYSHVVGEVQNQGTQNLEYIELQATFYAPNGTVIETDNAMAMVDVLIPQQKAPVDISVSQANITVASAKLLITSATLAYDKPDTSLSTLGIAHTVDQLGYYHVTGEVKNSATSEAVQVQVVVTFYDASGKIVGASYDSPVVLPGGQSTAFDVGMDRPYVTIASFAVQVQVEVT